MITGRSTADAGRIPTAHAPPGRRLAVLVVDDHDVVHWGFRLLFGRQPWVSRCLSARGGPEAVALARRHAVDVALVDLFVGHESGGDICQDLRAARPGLGVLLISGAGRMSPTAARTAGASGFVSKDWASADVVDAVRMVGAGLTVFAPEPEAPAAPLSERERAVLELIGGGATNREIGASLHLSPHTIKEYTSAVYRKLGVRNRTEAVQRGQRLGLLD